MSRRASLLLLLSFLLLNAAPLVSDAAPPTKPVPPTTVPGAPSTPKVDSKLKGLGSNLPSPVNTLRSLSPEKISALANKRYVDPKTAEALYKKGLQEAKARFPDLFGKSSQEHHVIPKFIGGPDDGKVVAIDRAYHQLITNAFREQFQYGQGLPNLEKVEKLLETIYSKYPLPGIHF